TSVETNSAVNVGEQDAAGAGQLRVGGDQDAAGASQLGVVGGDEDAVGLAQLGVDTLKKEKQMIKVVEMKSCNELQVLKSGNEVEGLKSHIHGTLHSRMSPSSIVQVMESVLLSQNQLKAVRDIGFGSMEFLKLLYVDQFVLEEVRAAREIPILKGWTKAMLSTREKLELFKGRLGNIRAKKLDAGSSSMTEPKMLIILTKLREKYTLGIITSEVNTIQSVKEIAQKKKKQSKVYVADKEENAEKEKPEEEKVQGRKSKRLKKAKC
uniref:Uncharacterized protein n=1 Tax=Chenopodium quinoa TaxID=63459 RepID=A0A803NEU2_CHEQI